MSKNSKPHVIAVATNKGGTGKTTTAVSIAGELARRGHVVLLVDLDGQAGNATAAIYERGYEGPTLLSVLVEAAKLSDVVVATSEPRLSLLPASLHLLRQERELLAVPEYHDLLRRYLPKLGAFEFVVIDCPPSLGDLTGLALGAADVYIVPSPPEQLAFYGVLDVVRAADIMREHFNPDLRFAGVTFTRFNPAQRDAFAHAVVEAARRHFGAALVLPSIRKNVAVPNSQAYQQTVQAYDPTSNAAQDYAALTNAILALL